MIRLPSLWPISVLCACGPSVATDGPSTSSTDDGASGDATATTNPTTTSSTGDTGASSSAADDSLPGDATSGTTAEATTWSWDESNTQLRCSKLGPRLYVEIYPGDFDGMCPPSPSVDVETLVYVIVDGWDGEAGNFEIDADGPHRAGTGTAIDSVLTGAVTVEVVTRWRPRAMGLDLAGTPGEVIGTVDLEMCTEGSAVNPCGD
jgi:hypothetical protein